MRSTLLLLAALGLASQATSQGFVLNRWGIHPGVNDGTDRAGIPGPNDGDILVSVDPTQHQFIGNFCNPTPTARISGFRALIQDEVT